MRTGNEKPGGTELIKKSVCVTHGGELKLEKCPPVSSLPCLHTSGIWGAGSLLGSSQVLLPDIIWIKFFVDRKQSCAPMFLDTRVWTFIWRVSRFPQPWLCDPYSCWVSCQFHFGYAFCRPCLLPESELCAFSEVFWVPLLTSSRLLCQQHQTALRRAGHGYLEGCGAELSFGPFSSFRGKRA